jgi:hypothetical protein
MTMAVNSAHSAELQIIIWFLECDWEVYTPFSDQGTDLIVRSPNGSEAISIQVKHKQANAKNAGFLDNPWNTGGARFDYLIFFQPSKVRGVLLAKMDLLRKGRRISFFKKNAMGYPDGDPRPLFHPFSFDLRDVLIEDRPKVFTDFFSHFHAQTGKRLPLVQDMLQRKEQKKNKAWAIKQIYVPASTAGSVPPNNEVLPPIAA